MRTRSVYYPRVIKDPFRSPQSPEKEKAFPLSCISNRRSRKESGYPAVASNYSEQAKISCVLKDKNIKLMQLYPTPTTHEYPSFVRERGYHDDRCAHSGSFYSSMKAAPRARRRVLAGVP
jgi:hypothetical protein